MTRRPPHRQDPSEDDAAPRNERLQKVLAAAGIGSRRECEELILAGRIEVDRRTVTELGTRVDPLQQEIRVDGTPLTNPKRLYYAVNKPPGVVSTNWDPDRRPRVIDLVRSDERLFAIGRLDRTSEGLILVTNDGNLANRLTHPRYGIDKTYLARVAGSPSIEAVDRLRSGIHLAEGVARVASVHIKRRLRDTTELEIVLHEGRNREIRRLLARIGHKVLQLKRIAVGPLRLGTLSVGACRPLTRDEVAMLEQATEQPPAESQAIAPPKRKPRPAARAPRGAATPPPRAPKTSHVPKTPRVQKSAGKPAKTASKPWAAGEKSRRSAKPGAKPWRKKGR